MENNKIIINSEWLDNITFMVEFEPTPTTENFELEGVVEQVIVEYHKDENRWVVDKQYFDADGDYIDHDTDAFTPYEKAEYMTMGQMEYKKFHCENSWEQVVVADNYQTYDTLVDSIKNYYAKLNHNSEKIALEVEDFVHGRFIELIADLDDRFSSHKF